MISRRLLCIYFNVSLYIIRQIILKMKQTADKGKSQGSGAKTQSTSKSSDVELQITGNMQLKGALFQIFDLISNSGEIYEFCF